MTSNRQGFIFSFTAAVLFSLAGCGGSNSGSGEQTGFLSLGVSDGPIHNAVKVCIAFNEVELKGEGAPFTVDLGGVENINLLDFQGANAAPLMFNEEIPAGEYEWLRLGVIAELGGTGGTGDDSASNLCAGDASYIAMDGDAGYTTHNLYIPSGAQSGLKFINGFTIPANSSANLTAEFDLMQSITEAPGLSPDVKFRPTVRLVSNLEVGILTGQVGTDLATAEACAPSVYVFDDGVTPNGIVDEEEDANDPVATSIVIERVDGEATTYNYSIGFLLAGDYEVAFTCDGETFEPIDGKPATITAQQVTTVEFP
jgi:hypothetical protein